MKFISLVASLMVATSNAWTLHDGHIVPDNDPILKDAPAAGTKMSMAFETLLQAKEAYFSYILNVIN